MVHYLLLRFKENALTESIIDVFADKFESLEKQHEGIVNPQVYRNIVSREGNMDLMITVEMRSLEDLKTYLERNTPSSRNGIRTSLSCRSHSTTIKYRKQERGRMGLFFRALTCAWRHLWRERSARIPRSSLSPASSRDCSSFFRQRS